MVKSRSSKLMRYLLEQDGRAVVSASLRARPNSPVKIKIDGRTYTIHKIPKYKRQVKK